MRVIANFTANEKRVLQLMAEDKTTIEIADIMNRKPKTIAAMRTAIKEKCETKTTAGTIVFAIMNNLVDVKDESKKFVQMVSLEGGYSITVYKMDN